MMVKMNNKFLILIFLSLFIFFPFIVNAEEYCIKKDIKDEYELVDKGDYSQLFINLNPSMERNNNNPNYDTVKVYTLKANHIYKFSIYENNSFYGGYALNKNKYLEYNYGAFNPNVIDKYWTRDDFYLENTTREYIINETIDTYLYINIPINQNIEKYNLVELTDNTFYCSNLSNVYRKLVIDYIGEIPEEYKWIEIIGLISIALILLSNLWRLYDSKSF